MMPIYTVNGFPIRQMMIAGKDAVILVERVGSNALHPWVTARWDIGSPEWYWGHYFGSYDEAYADFVERAKFPGREAP